MTTHHAKKIISAITNNGLEGLIHTATALYRDDVRTRLHYSEFFERTKRATLPLISEDEAIYYSSTFTQEHLDKFNHVLNNLGTQVFFAQEMTVIDYGCGQGLATLAFLQYLKHNNAIANKTVHIHLIEPSNVTLALARQYVLAMAKHTHIRVNITIHQKTLAQYLMRPITTPSDMPVLHFFSNVLDIAMIQGDLIRLSAHINQTKGRHIICAVSCYESYGFHGFADNLRQFDVQKEVFCLQSSRFNSNRFVWQTKAVEGYALFACAA